MEKDEARLIPVIMIAAALAIPLAALAWRFGAPFLRQFFISPFQFFILGPWGVSLWAYLTGSMPTRSGPSIERAKDPRAFWMMVWYTNLMGAACFVFNLFVSWGVAARRP